MEKDSQVPPEVLRTQVAMGLVDGYLENGVVDVRAKDFAELPHHMQRILNSLNDGEKKSALEVLVDMQEVSTLFFSSFLAKNVLFLNNKEHLNAKTINHLERFKQDFMQRLLVDLDWTDKRALEFTDQFVIEIGTLTSGMPVQCFDPEAADKLEGKEREDFLSFDFYPFVERYVSFLCSDALTNTLEQRLELRMAIKTYSRYSHELLKQILSGLHPGEQVTIDELLGLMDFSFCEGVLTACEGNDDLVNAFRNVGHNYLRGHAEYTLNERYSESIKEATNNDRVTQLREAARGCIARVKVPNNINGAMAEELSDEFIPIVDRIRKLFFSWQSSAIDIEHFLKRIGADDKTFGTFPVKACPAKNHSQKFLEFIYENFLGVQYEYDRCVLEKK